MDKPKFRSLQGVRAALADPANMQQGIANLRESMAWGGMLERIGNQLGHYKDKELGSVLTTANRHLRFLDTQAIEASTISSSFDPAELRNGKMTVYLILPPEHMRAQAGMLRMWVGSLLRAVVKQGLGEDKKVHFILDEAASLGRMDVLDDAVDKYRGYGVRCQFYYQSLGQLKQCWADGKDQTLLSNTTQVFFGVNDPQTADYVSNRLGESTIIVESGGASHGGSNQKNVSGEQGSFSTSWNGSDNWGQQARKLLKPEEVATLNPRIAITFAAGMHPISTMLSRYYEGLPDASVSNWKRPLQHIEIWLTALGLCVYAVFAWWLVLSFEV
jgi:type IV secretion system protein VirD4